MQVYMGWPSVTEWDSTNQHLQLYKEKAVRAVVPNAQKQWRAKTFQHRQSPAYQVLAGREERADGEQMGGDMLSNRMLRMKREWLRNTPHSCNRVLCPY